MKPPVVTMTEEQRALIKTNRPIDAWEPLKPLVLLDVDGVVNAWPDDGTERHKVRVGGYQVIVSDETLEALKGVFRSSVDVVWCTAWREQANKLLPFLREQGVTRREKLDWVSDGKTMAEGGFTTRWKGLAVLGTHAVIEAQAEGRPIYWIEDFGFGVYGTPSAMHYTDIVEAGITPIDTAKEGKLTLKHLKETPFA